MGRWFGFGRTEPEVEEQQVRVASVVSWFQDVVGHAEAEESLRKCGWDVDRAKEELMALKGAEEGVVFPMLPRDDKEFRGAENAGNSCYLDALLMAMFAGTDAYDVLIGPKAEPAALAGMLRLFVNKIRSGGLVDRDEVKNMLAELERLGWRGTHSQEDSSELYTFIMDLLQAPPLLTFEALHHGALREDGIDDKEVSDRMLMLGIHDAPSRVHLLDLLRRELHEGMLEDISREVADAGARRKVIVNAWRVVALSTSSINVVPILLKRSPGAEKPVELPPEIDLSGFTKSGDPGRRLKLRSAVCRLGQSANAGHYVTYLFPIEFDGSCARWDDLRGLELAQFDAQELETQSYLLFYG